MQGIGFFLLLGDDLALILHCRGIESCSSHALNGKTKLKGQQFICFPGCGQNGRISLWW